MRYRLRTLLILLAIGPPVLAGLLWLVSTPRALQVIGPVVLIVVLAVVIASMRIATLIKKR